MTARRIPLADIGEHELDRWRGLAAAAIEPNPFFEPEYVLAQARALDALGDVVLAAETIAREAAQRRLEPVHHVQHLVLHGLLHLIGYDHTTEAQAVEMERLETEILTALGLEDPYASGAPSHH